MGWDAVVDLLTKKEVCEIFQFAQMKVRGSLSHWVLWVSQLSYHAGLLAGWPTRLTATAFNRLHQYTSSAGHRRFCYGWIETYHFFSSSGWPLHVPQKPWWLDLIPEYFCKRNIAQYILTFSGCIKKLDLSRKHNLFLHTKNIYSYKYIT